MLNIMSLECIDAILLKNPHSYTMKSRVFKFFWFGGFSLLGSMGYVPHSVFIVKVLKASSKLI